MKYYSDFYKTLPACSSSYFIGANTPRGFAYADASLLDESKYKKLYIIKGGPGTGKSSMMKKCASHFSERGADITYYYCSSDPDSLDAVVIKKGNNSIAIADGTSPHALDAALPGAVAEVINLGDFWDSRALEVNRGEIAATASAKALAFDRSKRYLASADEVAKILRNSTEKGFQKEKARKFIRRLITSYPKQKSPCERKTVITEAISMKGAFRLPTFENSSALIGISDRLQLSPLFFELLAEELADAGHSLTVSYSPLGEIAELRLPLLDTAFVPQRDGIEYSKLIRLSRFADKEYFSSCTVKRRFNEKCLLEILDGALSALSEARIRHFALEDIYISAMNFDGINRVREKLTEEIEFQLSTR